MNKTKRIFTMTDKNILNKTRNEKFNEDEIDVKKLVGKRIREYRKMHNMSQEMLSEIIEIDSKHLSNIELGKNMPNPQLLYKISKAFNIEIKDLFEIFHLLPKEKLKSAIFDLIEKLNEEQLRCTYKYIKSFVI